MNLNTITAIERPTSTDQIGAWRDGYAWLAGGTWLFSTPQISTDTLIDLQSLGWPALAGLRRWPRNRGNLHAGGAHPFQRASRVESGALFKMCCESLLASFKIWNAATVGGNICMSLPAGALISLTASLEGAYTLWPREWRAAPSCSGRLRDRQPQERAPAAVSCSAASISRPKHFPSASHSAAPRSRTLGRSAIIVIGTQGANDLVLTITAATVRPVQIHFDRLPDERRLRETLDAIIPDAAYFDDVHGSAAYKRHLTYHFAEQVRAELLQGARA